MFENGGRVYKALVKYANSTTGEIKVSIPQVFGASNEVSISYIGRSASNNIWVVPAPGSMIVVATDDDQFSNVFWMSTSATASLLDGGTA